MAVKDEAVNAILKNCHDSHGLSLDIELLWNQRESIEWLKKQLKERRPLQLVVWKITFHKEGSITLHLTDGDGPVIEKMEEA